jgi:hypothetical protein
MPDLGNLARNMPTGAKLVGILLDSDDPGAPAKARTILTRARADFPQILPSAEMRSILERVQAIPTTVFVDSKGQLVGEPIVGSRSEESYRKEIEARLRSLR